MSEIGIGSILYTCRHGRTEEFDTVNAEITGETRGLWLVGDPKYRREKVNKKTLMQSAADNGGVSRRWYTRQQADDLKFCRANRYNVSSFVLGLRSEADQLRAIMKILGMKERGDAGQ